jgi:tRNA pseudouridine32 synthase/23S rRNA pseudouridine746 synthase
MKSSRDDGDPLLTLLSPAQYDEEDLPSEFAYPHHYEPHPIATLACDAIKPQIEHLSKNNWKQHNFGLSSLSSEENGRDDAIGKMFGALVVRTVDKSIGYLKAYSGTLSGVTHAEEYGFCPMVYNRLNDVINPQDGSIFSFRQQQAELNAMNHQVTRLEEDPGLQERKLHLKQVQEQSQKDLQKAKVKQKEEKKHRKQQRVHMKEILSGEEYEKFDADLIQQSAKHQRHFKRIKTECQSLVTKAEESLKEREQSLDSLKQIRKEKSAWVQNQLFEQYRFLNINGKTKSLLPIFENTAIQRPPSGAGDCAAPKLLQYAFLHNYQPIAMAEFWWGKPPATEVRKHNFYYPACRGKCEPILQHMLEGMKVQDNPLDSIGLNATEEDIDTVYSDPYILVVNKPRELLSVPGRRLNHSVYTIVKERYPNATGPLLVHRLDMSTSGILLVAKNKESHQNLQAQFVNRTVKKRYTALLEGTVQKKKKSNKGTINLPLGTDYLNRPMQKVDYNEGKPAVTHYEIINPDENGKTRIHFYPVTGRTHQLRVHAVKGLDIPIVGDDIYGQRSKEHQGLCLHAGCIEFDHPVSKRRMIFTVDAPF